MLGGEQSWRAWGNLLHAVRTGETAFEHLFGMGSFAYSALHPERAAMFDAYMADLTHQSVGAILASHDFSRYQRIVDVGGGNGVLLSGILAAIPEAEGFAFDTPTGVEGAKRRAQQAGVADRCRIVAGDFFAAVPEAADAYILKSVLHDWDDDRAITILRNCRRAMRPDSTLLVVERLLPERIECSEAHREIVMMDMHMLVMPGGRERTATEYAELFVAAGLKSIGDTVNQLVRSQSSRPQRPMPPERLEGRREETRAMIRSSIVLATVALCLGMPCFPPAPKRNTAPA